ncbi:MAG: hypothetical protein FD123_255 [Bacteroidetes bacterium]|nr:MAG: hypothetical protein FD123_255 [Bacteroidota bacterium]
MIRVVGLLLIGTCLLAGGCRSACQKKQSSREKLLVGKHDFGKTDTKKYKRMNRRSF